MRKIFLKRSAQTIGLLLLAQRGLAHPIDVALIRLTPAQNHQVAVEMELNPALAGKVLGHATAAGKLSPPDTEKLFSSTLGETTFARGNAPCTWQNNVSAEQITEQTLKLSRQMVCLEPGNIQMSFNFLQKLPATFRLLVQLGGPGIEQLVGVSRENIQLSLEATESHQLKDFVTMGISHIGAAPSEWHNARGFKLPAGLDHILFVVALLLAGSALLDIFKVVSSFTVGHSITLALGAFNLIHIPSQIVESAIALSIAIVAAESIFLKKSNRRWKISFVFGIVHGMGFATALTELQLKGKDLLFALVGFNLGVEIGQAIILVAIFPLLWLLRNSKIFNQALKPALATSIFLLGSYWFIERAIGG